MTTATGTSSHRPGETSRSKAPVDDLESAVYLAGLTVVVAAACASAGRWAGAWALTVATGAGLIVVGRHLSAPHAAFATIASWCIITGFAANGDAMLTFGSSDLWRLTLLTVAAILTRPSGPAAHDTRRYRSPNAEATGPVTRQLRP